MALPFPSKGKPYNPGSTEQTDRDTILMKPMPDVGTVSKSKLTPGKLSGRTMRIGKK